MEDDMIVKKVTAEDLNAAADAVLGTEDDTKDEVMEEVVEEASQTSDEPEDIITDPDHPLNDVNKQQLTEMIKTVGDFVRIMEENWKADQREFKLTDTQMKEVYQFNEQHRDPPPEGTSEDDDSYYHFNGIDKMTEEDVEKIFGKDHLIIGVDHSQTLDRIKYSTNDFFSWLSALKEYREVYDAYYQLVDLEEEHGMEELRRAAESEPDPVKKAHMMESLDLYYNHKYLKFLAEPLTDKTKLMFIRAYHDEQKLSYWVNRCRDKLRRMHVSDRIVAEMYTFETRHLDEKYHDRDNMLLLYFINLVTFCNPDDKKDMKRHKAICMTLTMDRLIRNNLGEEQRKIVLDNICKYLDQFDGEDLT